jgi:Fe-S-cluster-containing dehydrogenase component
MHKNAQKCTGSKVCTVACKHPSLEAKAAWKQALLEESRLRKIVAEENKERRHMEKLEKEKRC